jgi:DNA-binding NarL/FixJ family response regulator
VSSKPPTPISVVLVDDVEELRVMLRTVLEHRGEFTVVDEAADGEAGVQAVLTHRPDLVLLDISMPVLDGLETLPLIREGSPETIVVVLSSFRATSQAAARAIALGAHAYLVKGASVLQMRDELRAIVATAMAKHARQETGPPSRTTLEPAPGIKV